MGPIRAPLQGGKMYVYCDSLYMQEILYTKEGRREKSNLGCVGEDGAPPGLSSRIS
jgi:hypothetical protein